MANDKKNVKSLVTNDDDPTAELEALVLPEPLADDELEASASTAGFTKRPAEDIDQREDLSRSETTDRLQFDMEILRAKWQGLATEIKAREEHANKLNDELTAARQATRIAQELIATHAETIDGLELTIKQRDEAYRSLSEEFSANTPDDERVHEQLLILQSGQLASSEQEARELRARIDKSEEYADQLRFQLQRHETDAADSSGMVNSLERELSEANRRNAVLLVEMQQAKEEISDLSESVSKLHDTHAEEIRMIRFELGDAQETLTQRQMVAEQLASDLVETRSHRAELENMLAENEESSKGRIKRLKKENKRLSEQVENLTDRLQTKSEAVNCLLAELAKNSTAADPVAEIEDAIEEIDSGMTEQIGDQSYIDRDRVTRLLIGKIGGQELRFPLFKDRLTMGRTRQNDIQLKSEHISRRHAVVVTEGEVTRVIDWGSKNGVFVNSKRVKEHFLQNGDTVGVGTAEFRYEERPKRDA